MTASDGDAGCQSLSDSTTGSDFSGQLRSETNLLQRASTRATGAVTITAPCRIHLITTRILFFNPFILGIQGRD